MTRIRDERHLSELRTEYSAKLSSFGRRIFVCVGPGCILSGGNEVYEAFREGLKARGLDAEFDGELQADAALVPEIARRKGIEGSVAGHASVLIFPDLNSGNIASKLIQHLARANAYGQILMGLDRPAADVSRGSSTHDILGVAAIVGVQAVEYHRLYPGAGQKLPGEE